MPLQPGTHLLYGRNGVGKSTIINSLTKLFMLNPVVTPRIRLFVELLPSTSAQTDADNELEFEYVDDPDDDDQGEDVQDIDLDDSDQTNDISEFEHPSFDDVVATPERIGGRRTVTVEQIEQYLVEAASNDYWWSQGYRDSLNTWDDYVELVRSLDPESVPLDIEQFVSTTWGVDESVTLAQARLAYLAYCFQNDSDFWDAEGERPHRDLTARAIKEVATQPFWCISSDGVDVSSWSVSPAIACSSLTPATNELLTVLDAHIPTEVARILAGDPDMELADFVDEDEFLNCLGPTMLLVDWGQSSSQVLNPGRPSNFVPFQSWNSFATVQDWRRLLGLPPETFVNLNDTFDYPTWIRSTAKGLLSQLTHEGIPSDGNLLDPNRVATLDHGLRRAGAGVGRMDIGLSDLRFQVNESIADWIDGRPGRIQALDTPSGRWVNFEALSGAQQLIVGTAVRLAMDMDEVATSIVMGDEFDGGLHQTGVRSLYRFIDEVSRAAFISTHSPTALAMNSFSRIHVSRDGQGCLTVAPWSPSGSFGLESTVLGVDVIQLLATVRVVVLVEGSHDKTVIESLLDANSLGHAHRGDILVLPMRGHRAISTIADSFIWMDFIDAHVVALVDNATQQKLTDAHDLAIGLIRSGTSPANVVKRLGQTIKATRQTPEEVTLFELLQRAIYTGNIDRLSLRGLKRGDIIEYLPPEAFGLAEEWQELRSEHLKYGARRDFKSFLREDKAARISERTIGEAMNNLTSIPSELASLISDVLFLAKK
jgi:energy-coupling factor transporter ATP-binding protein EcfA2